MKVLKGLLWGMAFLALILCGGGLLLPARSEFQRSITVHQPPAKVFAALDSFQRFNEWSPWFELDTSASYRYAGPASGIGAEMTWLGNRSMGSGRQKILESVPNTKIVNALDFGGSQVTATFLLAPGQSGTHVTWIMHSDHGFNSIDRWFGAFLLERLVGNDYEKGLAKLKAVLEADPD